MKKKLSIVLLLVFSIFSKTNYMIISFPRSGSIFLEECIRKANPFLKRKNDFFHVNSFNKRGDDLNYSKVFTDYFSDYKASFLETALNKLWKKCDNTIGREVFAYKRVSLFQDKFTIIGLFRHRKHTFLSPDSCAYVSGVYWEFILGDFEDLKLNRLKRYILSLTGTELEEQCAAHIVGNYLLLSSFKEYNIPIIEFEKIVTLGWKDLHAYLKDRMPQEIFNDDLVDGIIRNRNNSGLTLKEREKLYLNLGVENYCQKIIKFIEEIDPDFTYIKYLE